MKQHQKKFTEGMLDDELILQELAISPGQTVVDAGCGNGYMSMLFSKEVGSDGKVLALDINEISINELNARCHDMNLEAKVCDISGKIPVLSGSVDRVFVSTVLHSRTREQVKSFVCEVERVLVPGGVLAVVEIAKHDTQFGPPLKQRYSPEELQAAVSLPPLHNVMVAEHFYMQLFESIS